MKPHEKVQETLKEVDQIGGIPSDQEFYNEFDSRLRGKLDLDEGEGEGKKDYTELGFILFMMILGAIILGGIYLFRIIKGWPISWVIFPVGLGAQLIVLLLTIYAVIPFGKWFSSRF